jgi:hypothetical protein
VNSPNRTRPTTGARRPALAWVLTVVIIGWALLTILLGVIAPYDRLCLSCHSMREYADAVQQSDHASETCSDCHTTEGIAGFITDGLAMERRIAMTIVGAGVQPEPLDADSGCRSCHDDALRGVIKASGIAVRHADFAVVNCTQCHGGTGHAVPARVYAHARMDDCLNCHQTNALDAEGCRTCHTEEAVDTGGRATPWGVMHGSNWRETHGAGDLETCSSCHAHDFCARCHGVTLPHPGEWPREHGSHVKSEGHDQCFTCHAEQWCADCHGLTMPHESRFAEEHQTFAQSVEDPLCLRCHESFGCQGCHERAHRPVQQFGTPHRRQVKP